MAEGEPPVNWDEAMSMSYADRLAQQKQNRAELLKGVPKTDTEAKAVGQAGGTGAQEAHTGTLAAAIKRRQQEGNSRVEDPKNYQDLRLGMDNSDSNIK